MSDISHGAAGGAVRAALASLGPLRIGLLALAVAAAVLAPPPQAETVLRWPEAVPTLIAPVVAPLAFMVLLLDTLMAGVLAAGADAARKKRMRFVVVVNILACILLAATWAPFFAALGRP